MAVYIAKNADFVAIKGVKINRQGKKNGQAKFELQKSSRPSIFVRNPKWVSLTRAGFIDYSLHI